MGESVRGRPLSTYTLRGGRGLKKWRILLMIVLRGCQKCLYKEEGGIKILKNLGVYFMDTPLR